MNVSDDLLISLFSYDAFLLLVKARNSSLLTVKPNLSFLKCLLLGLRKIRGHVNLVCA